MSFASVVTEVPQAHDPGREVDYKASTEAYKNYWTTCTDAYVFDIEERKKLSIQQLIPAPADVNIQSFEKRLASDMLHYLVHMPDKSMKQSLCVMPVNETRKPERGDWDRRKNDEFYIVNGQHSVSASKMMVEMDLDESILKHFLECDCYIVWSDNNEMLRTILAYYNRVNHFVAMKPSWSTNILGARTIWEKMGKPQNPKEATPVGTLSNARRNADMRRNAAKFKVTSSEH